MATRIIYAANGHDHMLMRLAIEGANVDLNAFSIEFDLGSVTVGNEDWAYSLGAFHNVEVLEFTLDAT